MAACYPNRPSDDWLREQYITHRRSCKDIAQEVGVAGPTIKRWLHQAEIPLRSNKESCIEGVRKSWGTPIVIPSSEELQRLFFDEKLTHKEIGARYCVSGSTVWKWMNDYGVKTPRVYKSGDGHVRYTGFGGITGFYWSNLRTAARVRQIPFLITIQEAWDLYQRQDSRCALTNLPLVFASTIAETKAKVGTASLDRIRSDGAYELGNVQWVHKIINLMKRDFPEEDFIKMCVLVAERRG